MNHLFALEDPSPLIFIYAANSDDPAGAIIFLIFALILMVIGAVTYFLPSMIAIFRGHTNWGPIAIVNLFFGWTFIGWVIALAWSVTGQRKD